MPSGLASGERASASLPFLPTLVTALVLAGASFLCREPAQDKPVPPVASVEKVVLIDPHAFPEPAASPAEPRPPAALAFAQAYPMLPAEPRAMASRPAPRIAAMPPRRPPCLRCEATPRRPEPALAARPAELKATEASRFEPATAEPVTAELSGPELGGPELGAPETVEAAAEDTLLPDLALPFAPATRAAGRAADFLRTGATALGGSVAVLVDRLR
ncbi:MAG TPA: hypothetical protein VGN94_10825 [Methylobacterium sp.]|nr:hypothetical protein [Methylobacterium sp.]